MPTLSPGLNRVASGPAATTSPTASWPGVISGACGGRSPSARCRSVRHTPQALIRTSSSPGPGSGTSRSVMRSGPGGPDVTGRGFATTHARTRPLYCCTARRSGTRLLAGGRLASAPGPAQGQPGDRDHDPDCENDKPEDLRPELGTTQ